MLEARFHEEKLKLQQRHDIAVQKVKHWHVSTKMIVFTRPHFRLGSKIIGFTGVISL
jgi:hypothetical protein